MSSSLSRLAQLRHLGVSVTVRSRADVSRQGRAPFTVNGFLGRMRTRCSHIEISRGPPRCYTMSQPDPHRLARGSDARGALVRESAPSPILLSQHSLVDLAVVLPWEFFDEVDGLWALVVG